MDRGELALLTADTIAKWAQPPAETIAKLPKPLKRDNPKGKCSECGGWHGLPAIHLDYMGHAEVTLALLDADPAWEFEPFIDERGLPSVESEGNGGNRLVMWGHMTVNGVKRLCVGTCDASKGDPEKELIGDALRNGAMRFGIGTKLWSKADSADPAGSGVAGRAKRRTSPAEEETHPLTDRVNGLQAEMRDLTGEQKAAMKEWGGGRSFRPSELLGDEQWLAHVEAWLDEQKATA